MVVPFELDAGIPVVEVELRGGQHRRYFLDTGCFATDVALADAGLLTDNTVMQPGSFEGGAPVSGGRVPMQELFDCSLTLGGIAFEHFDAVSADYPDGIIRSLKQPLQGGLGWPMFSDLLVTIDYARHRLIVRRGELPPANGSDVLPMRLDPHLGDPEVRVTLDEHEYWLLLDTGAAERTNLAIGADQRPALAWAFTPIPTTRNFFGGSVKAGVGYDAGNLHIGRYLIRQPAVVEIPGSLGTLSASTLQHFRITLDIKNGRARLEGPTNAAPGCDQIMNEFTWDETTERIDQPRQVCKVTVDSSAAAKGVTVTVRNGGRVISRPSHAELLLTNPGVLIDLTGDCRYTLRPDGGVSLDSTGAGDYDVSRWYEPSTASARADRGPIWLIPHPAVAETFGVAVGWHQRVHISPKPIARGFSMEG